MKTTEFISHDDSTVVKQTVHGLDDLLDYNHALRESGSVGTSEMKLVGHIPGEVLQDYCMKTGVSWNELFVDPTHIKRIMNNPDYSKFRIAPGRV